MIEDCPHGSVTDRNVTRRYAQKTQPALDLLCNLVTGKNTYPGCCQFDRKRHSLHQLADMDDCGEIPWRCIEPDMRPAGALQE
jgi:hypothetical protein